MVIEKIQKINLLQKLWVFIVGNEPPNMLTRVSVAIGLCVWFYFFSWHLLTFLTLSLMDGLDKAAEFESAFNRIGSSYQIILPGSITTYLFVHALVQLVLAILSLTGLILIWRQKKFGFVLYFIGNGLIYVATLFIMGTAYMWNELSIVDFVLLLVITLYFLVGYWVMYKR